MSSNLDLLLKTLPQQAGVYQFFDKNDKILYIGKAVNLKKRVASYFSKNHENAKTKILVSKIVDIKHIVVETETDALLLENNLIKKYQPRYNIMLKDDKTYPWICIKKERFPRVFLTRNVVKDGSEYFGPYASVRTANALLDVIKELYPLRTCAYDLSEKNIKQKKHKLCLDYHIGKCLGPCEELQTESDYNQAIGEIKNIIKGNFKDALIKFEELMHQFSADLKFEEAQLIKEKIKLLDNYQSKSTIVSPTINNVDVFSIVSDNSFGYVNFLKIANGSIIQSHTTEIKKKLDESDKELLEYAIIAIRDWFHSQSKELYVPFKVELGGDLKITIPKIGDKKHIIELSQKNAQYYRFEHLKQLKIVDPERHSNRILRQLQQDLRLKELPNHIECFDNSNLQGTNPVASCVVFKSAKPAKSEYRHFHIKSVEGPDDFASMEEVVFRRYKRMIDECSELPNLIIVDGGKGQLSSAVKSLELLGISDKVAIISIAKRLEEIYYPKDSIPLYLDKKSESLKIIQHLRNEAHRFGLTFHRKIRSKKSIQNELEQIVGIGKETADLLLKKFKSVKRISSISIEVLTEEIGKSKAEKIFTHLHQNM
ncbi:MAG: excinuclease ABC subunit UvrC [Flavobacteriaceae bacterium]|nr:excinuclease ABC subunit UvrC [Flavobacteriaceae bacterium]